MNSIFSLGNVTTIDNPFNLESISQKKIDEEKKTEKSQFKNVLYKAINDVNEAQIASDNDIEAFIRGDEGISMHNVILSAQEAQLSMQMLVELRNQLYDCYKELNNVTM
jgi:flagellar hook-basal body complex protein FliE